jgi:hypothetical protein
MMIKLIIKMFTLGNTKRLKFDIISKTYKSYGTFTFLQFWYATT